MCRHAAADAAADVFVLLMTVQLCFSRQDVVYRQLQVREFCHVHPNGCIPGMCIILTKVMNIVMVQYIILSYNARIYTNKIEASYKTLSQSDIFILSCHDYKQVQIQQAQRHSIGFVVLYMTYCTYTSN